MVVDDDGNDCCATNGPKTITVALPPHKECAKCQLQWSWVSIADGGAYVACADVELSLTKEVNLTIPLPPLVADEGDGTPDNSPAAVMAEDVAAGVTELPVRQTQAEMVAAGLKVGIRLSIAAGTAEAEEAEVAGFGSILLAAPTRFAHAAGTQIILVTDGQSDGACRAAWACLGARL